MKGQILIIDDEEAIRRFLSDVFIRAGYGVSLAKNGREGLEMARNGGFDVIVTDMVMPDMQGAEMIANLRRGGTDTPLVAMTGYSDGDARLDSVKDYCVDCVIFKPFIAREILGAVEQALQSRHLKPILGR
jgi:DNA-binding NtrC family response regulator